MVSGGVRRIAHQGNSTYGRYSLVSDHAPALNSSSTNPDSGNDSKPRRVPMRIKAAPKIRQIYWCQFWKEALLPEMWKERPVVIFSYRNTLSGHSLVLPTSTDPQEGERARWAHPLSLSVDGQRKSWVICNHFYTVSNARLSPSKRIPRIPDAEFQQILKICADWLPRLP